MTYPTRLRSAQFVARMMTLGRIPESYLVHVARVGRNSEAYSAEWGSVWLPRRITLR